MRKIVSGLFISLDGVTEAPDQWHFPYFNDEMGEAVSSNIDRCDALLFGRKTFEEVAGFWPNADQEDPFTRYINDTQKYVVSNTVHDPEWQPSSVIRGDVMTEIRKLKEQPGKDLVLFAGASLASTFIELDMVDEYRLYIHPLVLGNGISLFKDLSVERRLKLLHAKAFPSGVVLLQYARLE